MTTTTGAISGSSSTGLRTRDFLAIIIAVIITRMAWRDTLESSLDASLLLSFYVPSHGDSEGHDQIHIEPALLDVDGDGTAEALAVASSHGISEAWKLQILDLKAGFGSPSHQQGGTKNGGAAPFRPKVMLESKPITREVLGTPLKDKKGASTDLPDPMVITTGHVMMHDDDDTNGGDSSSSTGRSTPLQQHENHDINERTRHYFCGSDWHDASQRCGTPCPGGRQEECPGDEKCYADTPCDYYDHHVGKQRRARKSSNPFSKSLSTTPAGSVPSIVTMWDNGMLTLHSITADKELDENEDGSSNSTTTTTTKKKKRGRKRKEEELELRLMWKTKPLQNHTLNGWETHKLEFVDSVTAGNARGMIVMTAVAMVKYEEDEDVEDVDIDDMIRVPCVLAIDAKTGELMWETVSEHPELQHDELDEGMLKPLYKGTSSLARRRSFKPSSTQSRMAVQLLAGGGAGADGGTGKTSVREKRLGMLEANCMHSFRRSMLVSGALPFMFWSDYDISSRALHFEHQPLAHDPHHKLHKRKRKHQHNNKGGAAIKSSSLVHHDAHSLRDETPIIHQGHQNIPGGAAAERKLAHHQQQQHHQRDQQHHHANRKGTKSIAGVVKHLSSSWLLPGGGGRNKGKNGHNNKHNHRALHGPHHGRPNVIVTHYSDKLEVRSLKNGRSLCHLSLWQETLYADINHDGILDSVNVVTGEHMLEDDDDETTPDASRKWISQLVKRIQDIEDKDEKKQVDKELKEQKISEQADLCHLQVLSGVPSKEELYSTEICGPKRDQGTSPLTDDLSAAPPMIVEPLRGKGKDVVVALNTGVVTRVEGPTGQRQWQWAGVRHLADFPTWEDDSVPSLARIDSPNVIHSMRPILLAGENSMVILSARQGKYLASAIYPQQASGRPIVMDFNGDGTSDILIWTPDAFWGYQVHIRTGGSFLFRTIVGLVLMGLMLALLRNRFGPHPGKRSTDA